MVIRAQGSTNLGIRGVKDLARAQRIAAEEFADRENKLDLATSTGNIT